MKTEQEILNKIDEVIEQQKADGYYDDFNDGRLNALRWVLE